MARRLYLVVNGKRHRVAAKDLLRRTHELAKLGRVDLLVIDPEARGPAKG